ncbi:unannotated protein [freshwater metagenome]|uniref:Unannotated protein n=1 Tax=freshwater metagenome TaxID=449393 RepID=A0A6J6TGI2_9ZZZZ
MWHSTANVFSDAPTDRQYPTGIRAGSDTYSVERVPRLYGRWLAPSWPIPSPVADRVEPRCWDNDWDTLRYFHATMLLLVSSPAETPMTAAGRYWSWRKSSSRGHMSFTGLPIAMPTWMAWLTKSDSHLRPSPPPRRVVVTLIAEAGSPVMLWASVSTALLPCVGA